MQQVLLSDSRAKELLHDAFCSPRPVAPLFLLPKVARLYFLDEEQRGMFPERSVWTLNQAFTQAVKELKPSPQFQAGVKIGRYFTQVVVGGQSPCRPSSSRRPADDDDDQDIASIW